MRLIFKTFIFIQPLFALIDIMLNTSYQRKNNDNSAIELNADNHSEESCRYSFSHYTKAGLAVVGTVGTVALVNTAGVLPLFSWNNDSTPKNTLDNSHQLINSEETITFADKRLPILPKRAKRADLGMEFRVNTYTTNYQRYPSVAPLTTGDFVVAWQSSGQDGDEDGIYGQCFSSTGVPQGGEFQINTYTTRYQQLPSVASLTSGDFVVVWQTAGQGDVLIYWQRFSSTCIPLGSEFQINTNLDISQENPSIAALSTGDFVVVWEDEDGNGRGVYGQRYSSTGNPQGGKFQINTYTTGNQWYPSISVLSTGDFVVVWASTRQDGGGAAGDWDDFVGSGIYGQRYSSSGVPQGGEFQVNTYTKNGQKAPSVAGLTMGDFAVVWESFGQDRDFWGIYGQLYSSSGVPHGNEFQVNTYSVGYQLAPSVASLSTGDFVIVWQSNIQDSNSPGIYGQRYSSAGISQANEFQINTYITFKMHVDTGLQLAQKNPSVTALSLGNFVVVWHGFVKTDDSYDYNIYARIYFKPEIVNNSLAINEGEAIILNAGVLSVSDSDNNPSELTFTVSNVQYGQFENLSNPGAAITRFTQQDINDGTIQFIHDGSEKQPAYDVSISDGLLTDGPTSAAIIFKSNLNDTPTLENNALLINKGESIILTMLELSANDSDNNASELTFSVSNLQHGRFERVSNPGITIISFTQQEILDGDIQFVQDSSTQLPEYNIEVTDGTVTLAPDIATIVFIAQNQLIIKTGDPLELSCEQLEIQTQLAPTDLEIHIADTQFGHFEKKEAAWKITSLFDLSELNAGNIRFVHDGTENRPQYILQFRDLSTNYTFPRQTIGNTILNHPPELINPIGVLSKEINEVFVYVLPNNIFTDPDAQTLQIIVTPVNSRVFPAWIQFDNLTTTLNGKPVTVGSYAFKAIATDPYGATAEDRFYIDVKATNGTTIIKEGTNPVPIVTAIAGGAALLTGGIAASIAYFKKAQDRKTRQQHKFAQLIRRHLKLKGVDNFKSEDGQRFVQAVQSLSTLLQEEQGIDITTMDENRLDELASKIAVFSKNKITPDITGFWKKSKITISEFAENIKIIAEDVNRRLANLDYNDVSIHMQLKQHSVSENITTSNENSEEDTSSSMALGGCKIQPYLNDDVSIPMHTL